jgi:hypothetical protein
MQRAASPAPALIRLATDAGVTNGASDQFEKGLANMKSVAENGQQAIAQQLHER